MKKAVKMIFKILSTTLVAAIVVLAVLLAGVRLFGLTPLTVLSGSMEPTYHVGSIIYIKDVEPAELQAGDPVTFHLAGTTIATHRIIEVQERSEGLYFVTQGDANDNPDSPIPATSVIGKPVFTIPYLGYLSSFIQTPKGILYVVFCSVGVLLLSFIADAFTNEKKPEEVDAEENNGSKCLKAILYKRIFWRNKK